MTPAEQLTADAALPIARREVVRVVIETVDGLAIGARAVVDAPTEITPVVLRLMEMGLTAGTEIVVTRKSLGADPIEIRLRGTRLCLRRADAARFPIRRPIP